MIATKHPEREPALLILVEDDVGVRRALQLLLQGQGYLVHSFSAAGPALADPDSLRAGHVVSDYALPDGDGVSLVRGFRERGWEGVAVLITAFSSERVTAAARDAGIAAVIAKPFRDTQLLDALARTA